MSAQQDTAVAIRMQDLSPQYAEIMVLGKVLQMSGYFKDVQDQAQAVTKILFGRELGFSPIVSMGGIYIIEGKPALSANLLAATIKRSGKYDYRIKAWDNNQCVLLFKEKVDGKWEDLGESSFNMEDAKRAGVAAKSVWLKYPKALLFARALSQGERAYCPDVSACPLYVPEELGATVNESGEVLTAQDLPKSARPVAVTTEDIELGNPGVVAGAEPRKGPVEVSNNGGEHESQAAPAEQDGGQIAHVGLGNGVREAEGSGGVHSRPSSVPVEYITPEQTSALHIHFKDFLDKSLRRKADSYLESWCKSRGLVDAGGAGSTKFIKATYIRNGAEVSGFTEAKAALEQYALDLNVKMSEAK